MTALPIEYLFITSDYLVNVESQVTAFNASTRLGSIVPTRALMRLGYDARTYSIAGGTAVAEDVVPAAKRVVFGEMCDKEEGWSPTIAAYRHLLRLVPDARERAVFSIADDHFDDPHFRDFYAEALPHCLAVTTVSERLSQSLKKLTSRPVLVAPEPCEGARGAPQAYAARQPPAPLAWLARRIGLSEDLWRLRLLWFGYPMNLPPLLDMVPDLEALAQKHPLALTCVTSPVAEMAALMTPERTRDDSRLRVHFVQWSPLVMDSVIAASDIVLLPSEYRDPVKQAKSPNRLVAGLHGGRFVVAHPLPAYGPYAEFAWVGEDLCEGIDWAIGHPREVVERITRGQKYIDEKHSPEAVARFWLDVFHPKN
jgi:glycosyltransferase involved in cell wall biosynthesis